MSDWTEEAYKAWASASVMSMTDLQIEQIEIALRSAYHRGRVAGLREAGEIVANYEGVTYEDYNGPGNPPIIRWRLPLHSDYRKAIRAAADKLEAEKP